jgi:creatine kinase
VEETLKSAGYGYAYNDHLGYITTCPSNVGTGLRASVMLKLPKLYKKMGVHKLEELADSFGLQVRVCLGLDNDIKTTLILILTLTITLNL